MGGRYVAILHAVSFPRIPRMPSATVPMTIFDFVEPSPYIADCIEPRLALAT